jgi:hypothetical protein
MKNLSPVLQSQSRIIFVEPEPQRNAALDPAPAALANSPTLKINMYTFRKTALSETIM